ATTPDPFGERGNGTRRRCVAESPRAPRWRGDRPRAPARAAGQARSGRRRSTGAARRGQHRRQRSLRPGYPGDHARRHRGRPPTQHAGMDLHKAHRCRDGGPGANGPQLRAPPPPERAAQRAFRGGTGIGSSGRPMSTVSTFEVPEFTLENGGRLAPARLVYGAYGRLSPARDNAIVFPTAFGGRHVDNEWLIGPGLPLDTDRYFVIVPNLLGNGVSSSPSN